MNRLRIALVIVFLWQSVSLAAEPDCDSCESPLPSGCEKVCNGARGESRVVVYTSVFSNQLRALAVELEKSMPFLNVRLERFSQAELTKKILSEHRAGQKNADIIITTDISVGELLVAKVFKTYRSPFDENVIRVFRDEGNRWVSPVINPYALIFNSEVVRRGEAPRDLNDLLDPKWRGKIGVIFPDPALSAGLVSAFGEEKTRSYVNKLSAQVAVRIPDRGDALKLLIKGEFPVEINYLSGAIEFAKKGVPVGWNLLRPTITRVYPMGIANSAPHPNAAKLVYDFLLSVPGQRIFSRLGMIPANFKAAPTKDLSILKEQDYKSINVQDQNAIKIGTRIWEESFKPK